MQLETVKYIVSILKIAFADRIWQ